MTLALSLLLAVASGRAAPPPGEVPVAVFGPAEGLPGAQVRALALGESGELFVGTESGLARFDGRRFTAIDVPGSHQQGAERPFFTSLLEVDGTLLGQTLGSVLVASPAPQLLAERVADDVNSAITRAPDGRVLLASDVGLFAWRPGEAALSPLVDAEVVAASGLGDSLPRFRAVHAEAEGVWLGSVEGLWRLEEGRLEHRDPRPVRSFLQSERHGLIVGREDGLYALSDLESRLGGDCFTTDLAARADGRVVAACGGGMLLEERDGSWTLLHQEHGLAGDIVTRVVVDRDDIVWAGTLDQGLMRLADLDLRLLTVAQGLTSPHITDLVADGGDLVVTTHRATSRVHADGTVALEDFPEGFDPEDLLRWRRTDEGVFILANMRGVWRLRGEEVVQLTHGEELFGHLLATPQGAVWHAQETRLARVWPPDGPALTAAGTYFGVAWVTDEGEVLVPHQGGVSRLVGDRLEELAPPPPGCEVQRTAEHAGVLYGACANQLFRWQGAAWAPVDVGPFEVKFLRPALGGLYLGDVDALIRVAPEPARLDVSTGLPRVSFLPAHSPVGHGEWLAAATSVGVLFVRPERLDRPWRAPAVHIREVRAGDRDVTGSLDLRSDDDDLRLALGTDSLAGADLLRFRFRLDDGDWSEPFSDDRLQLAGLSRSGHTLQVQARLASGPWSAEPAVLAFAVPPRWYERRSVRLLGLGLVALVLVVIYRERTRRLEEQVRHLREAEEFRSIFGRFVTPEVAEEALSGRLSTAGAEAEVTVLFADVRGFTSLTERLPPDRLVRLLNRWYALTIAEIEAEGGVVNKLLGDAVVAIFGAPRHQPDHADRALRAARGLLRALAEASDDLEAEFGEAVRSGVGLNSGVVIAGPIGAPSRSEYTVIGEAVNVAARVEALTRTVSADLLITEATRARLGEALREDPDLRDLGAHALKGVSQPVRVWGLRWDEA